MKIEGLAQRLARSVQEQPDRVYARTMSGDVTYRALSGAADTVIARLEAAGLRRGEKVVLMMRNSPTSLAFIIGLLKSGIVWVPANPALVGAQLAHVIRQVEASLIVCDPAASPAVEACGAAARLGRMVIEDASLPQAAAKPWAGEMPEPSDLATIMFTSGTTGPAKGVQVTNMMLELAAKAVLLCANAKPGDNFYMWEPFYHIGGAQVLLLPLFEDVSLTIRDRFSASQFWPDLSAAGCTHIHHLGGIIQLLLKQPPSRFDREHKVRIAWGGGCAPGAWRPFEERFGVELRECYGMTEASSLTTCNLEGVVGSVGRPLPWFDVQLKDEDGRILGPSEGRGEILVTTSLPGAIFPGYFNAPEATAKALRPDGFYTGDIGSWDENGMLFFHGRMSDSIRCRGENVSAYEVEATANRHPAVEESAMVGVPAEIGEYDMLLFVRLKPEGAESEEDISNWLETQLAPYQRPRFISFVDNFPKTPSQRIQKHLLSQESRNRWERPSNRPVRKPRPGPQ
ncbi:class I adenylate-forming enzyme family protein [Mesorhizobium australicum]|uniref:class I adenylate-forming enzyme family protein n=1 Tax=Mesorhizobium australicum TaxID=536018 RepID=UPI0033363E91